MSSGLYTYYGSGAVAVPTGVGNFAIEPGSNPSTNQRGTLANLGAAAATVDVVWDDGRAQTGVTLQPGGVLPIFVRAASNAGAANTIFVIRHNNRR